MILDCPIIMINDVVMVVRFNNTEVQLPSIGKNAKIVRVMLENGKYSVVSNSCSPKDQCNDAIVKNKRKNTKKTTTDELAIKGVRPTIEQEETHGTDDENEDVPYTNEAN